MKIFRKIILFIFILQSFNCVAQVDTMVPVFKDAVRSKRNSQYTGIIKNIIAKNLSVSLSDSTEENWIAAFDAMEVLQFKQSWVKECIRTGFDSSKKRSIEFQQALAELVCSDFPSGYIAQMKQLMETSDLRLFALCSDHLLRNDTSTKIRIALDTIIHQRFAGIADTVIIKCLLYEIEHANNFSSMNDLSLLFKKDFLKGNTVLYSIQRKNRNFPGLAIIRNKDGNFIKDSSGKILSVPQLARSILNCPYYLTKGNTPQGIYKMNGLAVSRSYSIGPTPNIQLSMPFETGIRKFFGDSTITDTVWTEDLYKRLLPEKLKNYFPLYGTYYAGKAGRTEIIAHGTTVNPEYYKGQPYFPHTPTEGCLNTIEWWSEVNGRRSFSDQKKLSDALVSAGDTHGYCIVIEINDENKPVTLQDILPLIK